MKWIEHILNSSLDKGSNLSLCPQIFHQDSQSGTLSDGNLIKNNLSTWFLAFSLQNTTAHSELIILPVYMKNIIIITNKIYYNINVTIICNYYIEG